VPCARPRRCEHRRDPRAPHIHSRRRPLFHGKAATCDCRAELECSNIGTCAFGAFVACHAPLSNGQMEIRRAGAHRRPRGDLWTPLPGAPAADAELRRLYAARLPAATPTRISRGNVLLPGTTGDENDWTSGGGFGGVVLDTLIAERRMVPILVVMHASDALDPRIEPCA
jgi:hypothetical protein